MTHLQQTAFENIMGKEEIARDEQFLHFPQCFQLNQITLSPFVLIFDIIPLFAVQLEGPKIGISGKGLNKYYQHTIPVHTVGVEEIVCVYLYTSEPQPSTGETQERYE